MPAVLTVLGGQSRHPDAVVGVDAGSTDASPRILTDSLGHDRVVQLDAAEPVGFGRAVAAGLASGVLRSDSDEAFDVDTTEWIWLLHDDSAPAPDCLEQLLLAADQHPRAAILGPKARGWHDRRLLLEVGFSVTGSGRRVTGLERREHDQGQHDDRSEVHAVGSAGMLIRRDAWDALGGFDPALPLYRDDLDLCWRAWRAGHEVRVVPEAVIHHREASYHGRREGSAAPGRGHRLDRRSALHALLVEAPAWRLPFTTLRLGIGTLLRSLLYLLGKDLRRAGDEVAALGVLIAHPSRLREARRRVAASSSLSSREAVHDLRPRATTQARAAVEALGGIMASGRGSGAGSGALESGPVSDDADMFEDPTGGLLRRALVRPTVGIVAVLVVMMLIAGRGLWWGEGALFGGALLPSPDGAGDLWGAFTRAWHDVGPGSTVPAAPALAVLAALSTLILGKASLTVGLVILLASAAAGLSAWGALSGLVLSRPIRAWAALAYAVLPVTTASLATGRLGILLAVVVGPPAVRLLARALGLAPVLAPPTGRTAWAAALLLAVAFAGAPLLWPLVILGVIAVLVRAAMAGQFSVVLALRAAVVSLVPLLLLMPWSLHLLANPTMFLVDVGAVDPSLAAPRASAWELAALNPGGAGAPIEFIGIGIVIAALAAILRRDRRPLVLAAWGAALVAYLGALVLSFVNVSVPSLPQAAPVWPGVLVLVMSGSLILAAGVAGDGLRESMSGSTFTWRQPVSLIATLAAVTAPILGIVLLLPGLPGPLHRADPQVLPPFAAAESVGPEAPRTLLLSPSGATVGYALVNGAGPTLGDGSVAPPAQDYARLDRLVSGLVSGRGGDEVIGLAQYAVRYVIVQSDTSGASGVTRILDSAPGLRRVAGQDGEVLWRVDIDTARVAIAGTEPTAGVEASVPLPVVDLAGADPLAQGPVPSAAGEVLLSQTADAVWIATVGGRDLVARDVEGLQQFTLPAGETGALTVAADGSTRTRWLWIELIFLLVVVVLALPGRRQRRDDDVADDQIDEDDVAVIAEDGVEVTS